jgi:3-mercaptopyruvate sulfurtransferase SseA
MDMGYKKVYALKGGWREWKKAGYPTEPKQPAISQADKPAVTQAAEPTTGFK